MSNAEEWYQVSNGQVGTQAVAYYQHNLIKQKNLPLTRPLRDIGTAIADDQGDVVVNRVVDRLDNVLRPIVDAGYDGGEPGGTRHVGHGDEALRGRERQSGRQSEPVPGGGPVGAKPKTPLRDAIKTVRNEVKKIRDSLKPKDNED